MHRKCLPPFPATASTIILPLFSSTFASYCLCFLSPSRHIAFVFYHFHFILGHNFSNQDLVSTNLLTWSDMQNVRYGKYILPLILEGNCVLLHHHQHEDESMRYDQRKDKVAPLPPPSNLLGIISSATILPNNRAALASGNFTNPSTMRPVIAGARRLKVERMIMGMKMRKGMDKRKKNERE